MENKKQQQSNNQSNNALSLGKMIQNAEDNMDEAEISMEFASPEERENLEEKSACRRHSIDKIKKQKRDEAAFQARKDSFK